MSEYADRPARDLEPHYSKHVEAMTGEGLHSKDAIAAELAFRDAEIECLRQRVIDAEMQLGPFDEGEDSEYWNRYPVFMHEQSNETTKDSCGCAYCHGDKPEDGVGLGCTCTAECRKASISKANEILSEKGSD